MAGAQNLTPSQTWVQIMVGGKSSANELRPFAPRRPGEKADPIIRGERVAQCIVLALSARRRRVGSSRPAACGSGDQMTEPRNGPAWKHAHRDWRVVVAAVFIALAMIVYVLTENLSWRPGVHRSPPASPRGQ